MAEHRDVRAAPARERILAAADALFYGHGIHAVGIDRIVTEAGVTRVTFYRHFASKDDLIAEYLRLRGERLRGRIEAARADHFGDPRRILEVMAESLVDDARMADYRGCEFVNAAAEFADADHAARTLGAEQRAWLVDAATDALQRLGHGRPERLARQLLMLRTGATVVSGLDCYDDTAELFFEAWTALLDRELAAGQASPSRALQASVEKV